MEDLSKQANTFKDGRLNMCFCLPGDMGWFYCPQYVESLVLGGEIRVEVRRLTHFLLSLEEGRDTFKYNRKRQGSHTILGG